MKTPEEYAHDAASSVGVIDFNSAQAKRIFAETIRTAQADLQAERDLLLQELKNICAARTRDFEDSFATDFWGWAKSRSYFAIVKIEPDYEPFPIKRER